MSVAGKEAPTAAGLATPPFARVAVIGLGVMGGSLTRALRSLPRPPYVVGFTPAAHDREAALAAGALDEAAPSAELAAATADLVVYATPLRALLELQAQHAAVWRPDAVVSDLSSLKVPPAAQARALGVHGRYVSAHPMVGSAGSGFRASSSGLYAGAAVWLSGADLPAAVAERVERFWSELGARPAWIDAAVHDARMVHASHLPQILANVLARYLEECGLLRSELGSGGRDMTRLAGSSPEIWRDLLEQSAPQLAPALRGIGADLEALAALLEAGDVEGVAGLMERTRAWSRGASGAGPVGAEPDVAPRGARART